MRVHLPSIVTCAVVLTAISLFFLEVKVPPVETDPASGVRGSLGVSLEDSDLNGNLGRLSFLLNGGFALLSGAFACFLVAKPRRNPRRDQDPHGDWRSGNSVPSI